MPIRNQPLASRRVISLLSSSIIWLQPLLSSSMLHMISCHYTFQPGRLRHPRLRNAACRLLCAFKPVHNRPLRHMISELK